MRGGVIEGAHLLLPFQSLDRLLTTPHVEGSRRRTTVPAPIVITSSSPTPTFGLFVAVFRLGGGRSVEAVVGGAGSVCWLADWCRCWWYWYGVRRVYC